MGAKTLKSRNVAHGLMRINVVKWKEVEAQVVHLSVFSSWIQSRRSPLDSMVTLRGRLNWPEGASLISVTRFTPDGLRPGVDYPIFAADFHHSGHADGPDLWFVVRDKRSGAAIATFETANDARRFCNIKNKEAGDIYEIAGLPAEVV